MAEKPLITTVDLIRQLKQRHAELKAEFVDRSKALLGALAALEGNGKAPRKRRGRPRKQKSATAGPPSDTTPTLPAIDPAALSHQPGD